MGHSEIELFGASSTNHSHRLVRRMLSGILRLSDYTVDLRALWAREQVALMLTCTSCHPPTALYGCMTYSWTPSVGGDVCARQCMIGRLITLIRAVIPTLARPHEVISPSHECRIARKDEYSAAGTGRDGGRERNGKGRCRLWALGIDGCLNDRSCWKSPPQSLPPRPPSAQRSAQR